MKEDLHAWFQGIGYERGFGLGEVPSTEVRKRLIDTYTIVGAINWEKIKNILGEDGVLDFFFKIFFLHT